LISALLLLLLSLPFFVLLYVFYFYFLLLFSCRWFRNLFRINSLHCEELHFVTVYVTTSRGFFAQWYLMIMTEMVTQTITFDPAITQLIALERVIRLTGYCMPFIKRFSIKIVCGHASTEVLFSRITVLLSIYSNITITHSVLWGPINWKFVQIPSQLW
jgi:hypothetical protein